MNCRLLLLAPLLAFGTAACATETAPSAPAVPAEQATNVASERPQLVVRKTPWCGCCGAWASQAEAAGFAVEVHDHEDLGPIKRALGVPAAQASCHTAEVGGYFIEGHVPFADIHRLLAEKPAARGLAVPGMPLGSPGMEADVKQAYSVNLVGRDGSVSEFSRHNEGGKHHHEGHHGHEH